MPGMQDAGRSWSDHQADVYTNGGGFERCPLDSQMYRKQDPKIRMEVHGDDGAAVTDNKAGANWHMQFMTSHIDCSGKVMGLGPGESREERFLKKTIRVDENGWELEADPKHINNLLKMHGLEGQGAKGCATPWDKEVDKMRDGDDELNEADASLLKTGAGIGQYVSSERFDLQYCIKEIRREAGTPTKRAQARLKRVARYLVSHRRVVVRFRFWTAQEKRDGRFNKDARRARIFVDASHAGCKRTRKSTTGGVTMRGPHNLGEFVATQIPISISSGESEFYAIVRAVIEAKFVFNLLCWLEFDSEEEAPEIASDAIAALGAAARLGVGKRMRHIDTQHLFIQKEVNEGKVKLKKVKGLENPADAGTKPLNEPKLKRLLDMVGVKFITAALMVAQAKAVEGAVVGQPRNVLSEVVTRVQEVSTETVTRMQSTVESGLGTADFIMLVLLMLIYEIMKELLKAVLVDKLRSLKWNWLGRSEIVQEEVIESEPTVELAPSGSEVELAPGPVTLTQSQTGHAQRQRGHRGMRKAYLLDLKHKLHANCECAQLAKSKRKYTEVEYCTTCGLEESDDEA